MENSKKSPITVDAIYDTSNDDYKLLQLRSETEKEGGNNALSQFLKGGNTFLDKRVAFQSMHVDIIEELGVKEGSDLNDLFDKPVRLAISEITESEFLAMRKEDSKSVIPYSAKINPDTKKYLVDSNGEYIYRGVTVELADVANDVTIPHAGSVSDAPEFLNGRLPQEKTEDVQA